MFCKTIFLLVFFSNKAGRSEAHGNTGPVFLNIRVTHF